MGLKRRNRPILRSATTGHVRDSRTALVDWVGGTWFWGPRSPREVGRDSRDHSGEHPGEDWGSVELPEPGREGETPILEFDISDGTEMPKSVAPLVSCPRLRQEIVQRLRGTGPAGPRSRSRW